MQRGGFLSDSDRACLDRFPLDVNRDDLVRCFSLGGADLDLVWGRLSAGARLAGGLQIGALRLVGFVPDDLGSAPAEVIEFVAVQVDASSEDLDTYWNTAYIAHAIDQMQRTGTHIDDRHITRLSPASHNHINFYGRYDFTNPKPPPTGTHRPLRVELDRPISSI